MSGAGKLEVIMGAGGREVPAGGQLEVTLRVVLEEASARGALKVMVGWEQLGSPGGLHLERELRQGPWEAGVHEVPFSCGLREEPATPRGEAGAMWFVAARLGELEHRVYFRLTPRGEGAMARRDVNAFLSAASSQDRPISTDLRILRGSKLPLEIQIGAVLAFLAIFLPFASAVAWLGCIALIVGLRWITKDRASIAQGEALTLPVLGLNALEFELGDTVRLELSFIAREAVQVRGVTAALVMGERRIEPNLRRRESMAPEEIVRFKERAREQRSMSGVRAMAAGEVFEEEVQLPLPRGAQPSGLDGTGIVWRAQVRIALEGLAPLEEEVFFRVRRRGEAREREDEVGDEVEDEGGEEQGSGW